jgi:hypothetical protein
VMCCMRVVAAGPALTLCWAVVCSMHVVLLTLRTCCPLLCAFGVAISPLLGPLPRQHCNSLLLSPLTAAATPAAKRAPMTLVEDLQATLEKRRKRLEAAAKE